MGYAHGQNNNGREIGYGVEATCDLEGCDNKIDRGVGYCCGGLDGTGNAGMDDEPYCGGFFCDNHFTWLPTAHGKEFIQVCEPCYDRQVCPTCKGDGGSAGAPCALCDSCGVVAQRAGEVVETL